MKGKKVLVVGQGLAGTCLTWQLEKRNIEVFVLDSGIEKSSSVVAAGLYNPIVFKRFTQSWMAKELIEYLNEFYSEIEDVLKCKFHTKHHILKVFTNDEERKLWMKKAHTNEFMLAGIHEDYLNEQLTSNLGIAHVVGGGAINLKKLLTEFRNYLISQHRLIVDTFDYDRLKINASKLQYGEVDYDLIIFCEGAAAMHNPFFPKQAFKLTHGETFEILADDLPDSDVINKGAFLLPKGNRTYKVGATYRWENVDGKISNDGYEELKLKLDSILKVSYEVSKHEAGIRPTVVDRRPLMGHSLEHKQLCFFNGMGTKGVMLAPFFSEQFVKHILDGESLSEEVDIARYY